MKKYLLTTLLVGALSISYAGIGCGDISSDSCDKDSSAQEFTQSSSLLAKSCGSCGGCGGDKSDKTEKSGKSGFEETSVIFAGSCDDDEDKKKCGSKSFISA